MNEVRLTPMCVPVSFLEGFFDVGDISDSKCDRVAVHGSVLEF